MFWGQEGKLEINAKPANQIKLYNLERDPFETKNMADEKPDKVERLKDFIRKKLKFLKSAYHPSRHNAAFPRYNGGLVSSGWCDSTWDQVLWQHDTDWQHVLKQLETFEYDSDSDYDYDYFGDY